MDYMSSYWLLSKWEREDVKWVVEKLLDMIKYTVVVKWLLYCGYIIGGCDEISVIRIV